MGSHRALSCAVGVKPRYFVRAGEEEWGDSQSGCLGVSDKLGDEEGEAFTKGPGVDEAHRFLLAGLAEEVLTRPEYEREHDQPQLVDQVMLHQGASELIAGSRRPRR